MKTFIVSLMAIVCTIGYSLVTSAETFVVTKNIDDWTAPVSKPFTPPPAENGIRLVGTEPAPVIEVFNFVVPSATNTATPMYRSNVMASLQGLTLPFPDQEPTLVNSNNLQVYGLVSPWRTTHSFSASSERSFYAYQLWQVVWSSATNLIVPATLNCVSNANGTVNLFSQTFIGWYRTSAGTTNWYMNGEDPRSTLVHGVYRFGATTQITVSDSNQWYQVLRAMTAQSLGLVSETRLTEASRTTSSVNVLRQPGIQLTILSDGMLGNANVVVSGTQPYLMYQLKGSVSAEGPYAVNIGSSFVGGMSMTNTVGSIGSGMGFFRAALQ